MLVVIRRARLAKILEHPDLLLTGFDTCFGFNSREAAECSEAIVGSRSSPVKHRIVWMRILRPDAHDVRMNRTIHWPVKRLVGLDTPIVDPSPG